MVWRSVTLIETPFDAAVNYADFSKRFMAAGAVVSFCGRVRPLTHKGQTIDYLYLDWYPGMTQKSLDHIVDAALGRFDLLGVFVMHRCAKVTAQDIIVQVLTASAHRRAAFEAADFLMDKLKSEAALWKREVGPEIDHWVEPSLSDAQDLMRWG
jgi:molybdopterin synthase catalytic subunit